MKRLLKRIRYWWKFEGRYYLYDIREGVVNLFIWFKIIWKDRPWDQSYLLRLIQFKLNTQIKYWIRHDIVRHKGMESDVRLMRICVKLIDIILDETYSMDAMNYIENKYGPSDFKMTPYKKDKDGEQLYSYNFEYEKVNDDNYKEFNNEQLTLNDIANKQQDKANKLLFHILEERVHYWWT